MKHIDVIAIEDTTLCGANCIMCPRDKFDYHSETMDFFLFTKCVDDAAKHGVKLINLTGFGDSLLSINFEKELQYIKKNYPYIKIGVTNTCHLINEKKIDIICKYVDELQISMYGITKETYESIHRGRLVIEDVKNNIDNILNKKDRPHCILEFLLMDENRAELDDWLKYYEGRADRVDVWKLQNWAGYLPSDDLEKDFKPCFRIDSLNGLYIRADGRVSVCCVDYNRKLTIGDMRIQSLEEILTGSKIQELQKLNHNGKICEYSICKDCDQIHDRSDALVYSSDGKMKVGRHTMMSDSNIYEELKND